MRKLWGIIKWIAKHLVVKPVNLNDDKEGPPKPGVVIGISGEF